MTGSTPLKSYRITIAHRKWRTFEAIVRAPTRGRAKSICLAHAHRNGFWRVRYLDIRAVRSPEFDNYSPNGIAADWCLGYRDGSQRVGCLAYKISNVRDRAPPA